MNIVALDVESGGLFAHENSLLSLSMVKMDSDTGEFLDELDLYILPQDGFSIHPRAAEVNGYTPERWAEHGAVALKDAFQRAQAWLTPKTEPVAHNAGFDKAFIEAAQARCGVDLWLSYRWHCSMATFHAVNTALSLGFKSVSLDSLARAAGHWDGNFTRGDHKSIEDAKACARGYKWLLEKIRGGSPKTEPDDKQLTFESIRAA